MLVYQDIIESVYQENGPVICGTGFFENQKLKVFDHLQIKCVRIGECQVSGQPLHCIMVGFQTRDYTPLLSTQHL